MNRYSVGEVLYFDTIKWTFGYVKQCLQSFKQRIEERKDLTASAQRGSLSSTQLDQQSFARRARSTTGPRRARPTRYTRRAGKFNYIFDWEKYCSNRTSGQRRCGSDRPAIQAPRWPVSDEKLNIGGSSDIAVCDPKLPSAVPSRKVTKIAQV
jgi:hypothetical protein